MDGLKKKTEPLLEQRKKLETDLLSLRKNVDEARANFEIAESSLQLYTAAEESEREKLDKLERTLKEAVETMQQRKLQLKSLDVKIPATKKSLAEAQKEFDLLKKRDIEASTRLKNTRIRVAEEESAMQANRSRNKVLDALMQQKRQGNIPGISGRLVSKNMKMNLLFYKVPNFLIPINE